MDNPKNHKSPIQLSDEMLCSYCGKTWDVNDNDPPECSDTPAGQSFGRLIRSRWSGGQVSMQNMPRDAVVYESTPTGRIEKFRYPDLHQVPSAPVDPRFLDYMLEKPVAYFIKQECGVTGFLVYAFGDEQALGFAAKLLWEAKVELSVIRIHAMDQYCTGRAPRVEMNPKVIERANEFFRYQVVSPLVFRTIVLEKKKHGKD